MGWGGEGRGGGSCVSDGEDGDNTAGGADLRSMSATLIVEGLMHGARLRNTWDTTEASIAFQAAGLCRSKDVAATLSSRDTLAHRLWALNTQ